jgi:hypothetical protein
LFNHIGSSPSKKFEHHNTPGISVQRKISSNCKLYSIGFIHIFQRNSTNTVTELRKREFAVTKFFYPIIQAYIPRNRNFDNTRISTCTSERAASCHPLVHVREQQTKCDTSVLPSSSKAKPASSFDKTALSTVASLWNNIRLSHNSYAMVSSSSTSTDNSLPKVSTKPTSTTAEIGSLSNAVVSNSGLNSSMSSNRSQSYFVRAFRRIANRDKKITLTTDSASTFSFPSTTTIGSPSASTNGVPNKEYLYSCLL